MDERTRSELEAAVFRRLAARLRARRKRPASRGCGGNGIALDNDEAREIVYGMAPSEWKSRYRKEATREQSAAFAASQETHS
jgi:hypothetical protein